MILNPTDPSGTGLFSRCARNQALKVKPHQGVIVARVKPAKSMESTRRKSVTYFGFDKTETREQRESKYRKSDAPPVGHYKPIRLDRPKQVWDILKVYQYQLQRSKLPSNKEPQPQTQSQYTPEPSSQSQLEEMLLNEKGTSPLPSNMISLEGNSSMMSSNRSQCMVNMSRTTGRREKTSESVDWGDSNVMKSLGYVKGRITKNIDFAKQMKPSSKPKPMNSPASNYSYDFNLLKPRGNGNLDFGQVKGREEAKGTSPSGYQHYEYDSYVWQSNSRIFPNTKTHLIEFKKQTNRYRKEQKLQESTS